MTRCGICGSTRPKVVVVGLYAPSGSSMLVVYVKVVESPYDP
jgi:hypothetical protein